MSDNGEMRQSAWPSVGVLVSSVSPDRGMVVLWRLTLVFIVLWAAKVQALILKNSSNGLELHWVQGGPIVTLATLFLFLSTPYSNWQN